MMQDEELLSYSLSGFVPGPGEKEDAFLQRISSTKQAFLKLGVSSIPSSHWSYVSEKLQKLFSFSPDSLPAFYSNRSLAPWQGAAAWVERGQIIAIQLRKAFQKGSFLGIYQRSELLAHEAVHALRSAFPADIWDEFFAYMVSDRAWRRAIGPIIQRPWEVWPFFIFCLLGAIFPLFFLGSSFWICAGFLRLIRRHIILKKASEELCKHVSKERARAILVRLTDEEIRKLSKNKNFFQTEKVPQDLRERLIWMMYKQEVKGG